MENNKDKKMNELLEKLEASELALMYAEDIVNMWPQTTMRTLYKVTNKVAALKEALEKSK